MHAVLEELEPDIHVPIAPARLLGQDGDGCLIVGTDYCTIALREHVAPSGNLLRLDVERRARIEQ